MNSVVSFTTPKGEEMVVVSAEDYRYLVETAQAVEASEMASDVSAYDRFQNRLALGEEEYLPSEFVDRILDGANKTLAWREYRGLSAIELAGKAAVTHSELSDIECGKEEATVATMKRIAEALGVTIDEIV